MAGGATAVLGDPGGGGASGQRVGGPRRVRQGLRGDYCDVARCEIEIDNFAY